MMSVLGDKIDSVSIDRSKYGIGYDDIKIQSKLDMYYKTSASLTKDEVIYIRQGDIVRYFEEQKLEDLAKESDKVGEYEGAKKEFIEHKKKLEEVRDNFFDTYSSCEDLTNQSHILHNSTIENILNEEFVFNCNKALIVKKVDKSVQIQDAKGVLDNALDNISQLDRHTILDLETSELKLIQDFKQFIQAKIQVITKKESANETKLKFLDLVDSVVDDVNQQLNQGARSKSASIKVMSRLIDNLGNKFKSLVSLRDNCNLFGGFEYEMKQPVQINDKVTLVLEIEKLSEIKELLLEGIHNGDNSKSLYENILCLLRGNTTVKNHSNDLDSLKKKTRVQLSEIINGYNAPKDYLEYENGETSKKNSPGYNSEKYLEIILQNPKSKIIFIDQPEDNLGNRFITDTLVKLIRKIKFNKQIFLVTHNPSIVVYGDAESIIIAENNSNKISYKQVVLEHQESQKEICGILDGGEYIFDMRAKKYNIKRILKSKENE